MEKVRLGDVCDVRDGTHDSPKYHDSGYPLVTSKNLSKGFVDFTDCNLISKEDYDKINIRSKVDVGDILMPMIGTVGNPVIVQIEPSFAIKNVALIKFYKDSRVLNKYIKVLLESNYFDRTVISKIRGGTQKFISLNDIRGLEITLLPISEQLEIVDKIEKVNILIDIRKEQLEKLDDLVKARFVELFGDTILNPFGWEKVGLGIVCDVRDGTHDSPKYHETGYPLVTSKNVTGGKIDLTDCSLICEEDFNKINERSKVDIGDIIMPMIGTVGKPVIVDIEPDFAIKNVALIKFKADSKVLNIYIRALLQSDYFDDAVLSKVRGGTQKFISLGDIRKLEVLVPPMEQQNQFTSFVEQTDKSKLEIQKSLEKLELLKKALMQKYFG